MFPAFIERTRILGEHPELYRAFSGTWQNMVAQFESTGVYVDQAVTQTITALPREPFLLPCYQALDAKYPNDGETLAKEGREAAVQNMEGQYTPIWWSKQIGGINSTALSLIAIMVSAAMQHVSKLDRALVIGSGCGYVPAVLSNSDFKEVTGLELIPELAGVSRDTLTGSGYDNVHIVNANASDWLTETEQMFDVVVGFAALPKNRQRQVVEKILRRVNPGGVLVIPISQWDSSPITRYVNAPNSRPEVIVADTDFTPFIME